MAKRNAKIYQPLQLMKSVRVAVLIIDEHSGKILYINDNVCEDLVCEPVKILKRHYQHVFSQDFVNFYEELKDKCLDGREHSKQFFWKEKNMWEQVYINRIIWSDNKPAITLSITNLPELVRSARQFEQIAYYDDLLDIPNGLKLEEDISALGDPQKVALVYMRIVQFDNVNDLYGFDVGDALLIQVRDWLLDSETRMAKVYRVTNGFAILGRNVSRADGEDRASQIIRRFREPWIVEVRGISYTIYCSVNVGVVYSKYVYKEMRNLLMRTSRAPKNNAGFAVYDEKIDEAVKRDLLLRQTLNTAYSGRSGRQAARHPATIPHGIRPPGRNRIGRRPTP